MKFSIRALLALTAFVALLVAIVFTFPDWLASVSLMLLLPMVNAALVTSVFYARGDLRAFSVATLAVVVPLIGILAAVVVIDYNIAVFDAKFDILSIKEELAEGAGFFKCMAVLAAFMALPAGLSGVLVRRLLIAGQHESRSAPPDEPLF